MDEESGQPNQQPTVGDHWLLDHHIEELLRTFSEVAPLRESCPALEQRLVE
jgi:hypothetical protein